MPAPAPRTSLSCDLIALDLDGTLLRPDGTVSPRSIEAIHAARDAGLDVIVCTGRGYVECRHVLGWIDQTDAVIVAGGSITACGRTGRTLDRVPMHPSLVSRVVEILHAHAQAAMVLKDPSAAGYDYLVLGGVEEHPVDPVTSWWFEELGVTARFARTLEDDEHPEQTVRVGLCTDEHAAAPISRALLAELPDSALLHDFPAVVGSKQGQDAPRRVNIVEVFDGRASKWNAIERLASERGIDPSRVAAIGDEVNDVSMIRGAGLGVAMGNAVPSVAEVADRRTESNAEEGVANAIRRVLSGEW
ncbi:MAG: HAD hydrolase family protein [Phycisphaerales bacterium JB059]